MQSNLTCSICTVTDASYFCPCKAPLSFLCEQHIPLHFSKHRGYIHEVLPIEVLPNFQLPGFVEDYRRRISMKEDAVSQLRATLSNVEEWSQNAIRVADCIITRFTVFRNNLRTEFKELKSVLERDIENAIQENEGKFYEMNPESGPLVGFLRKFEPGAEFLTCKTDFGAWEKAVNGVMYGLKVYIETAVPEYKSPFTVSDTSQFQSSHVVSVYSPMSTYRAQIDKIRGQHGVFSPDIDRTPTLHRGPITTPSGVYIGAWNSDNQRHGFGLFLSTTGDLYEGNWINGEKTGLGRQIWSDGHMYEGAWDHQQRHGFGKLVGSEGDVYTGEYFHNKQHGFGYYNWAPSASSQFYVGEWANGQTNGLGAYFWRDGSIYAGYRKKHKKHGKAVMYWPDGRMYYGEFGNDVMHGSGCMSWVNGEMYVGEWRDGKRWGRGKQTASETYYDGKWVNDKKHGSGVECVNGGRETVSLL